MPALQATLDRYLATVEPLLSADEKEQTRRVVAEFGAGEGLELHAALEKLDATDVYLPDRRALRGSWIEHFWDDMYLEGRYPVVINSNPFLTFKPDPVAERRTQARRAANLVFASVTVSHMIDNYELDVGPECPSQYLQLFRTCRIPRFARDSLRTDVGTRHIVVMHRGRYYKLDVLSASACWRGGQQCTRTASDVGGRHSRLAQLAGRSPRRGSRALCRPSWTTRGHRPAQT